MIVASIALGLAAACATSDRPTIGGPADAATCSAAGAGARLDVDGIPSTVDLRGRWVHFALGAPPG